MRARKSAGMATWMRSEGMAALGLGIRMSPENGGNKSRRELMSNRNHQLCDLLPHLQSSDCDVKFLKLGIQFSYFFTDH